MRAYLAFAGGIECRPALGSRATYVRGRLGGLEGRALQARRPAARWARWRAARASPPASRPRPTYGAEPDLRWCWDPEDDRFTPRGIAAFLGAPYEMLPQSRPDGRAAAAAPSSRTPAGHDIISDGVALGGIQVIGDGQPIVLLADRQSTGGYTKIGTVCSFHIGRIAQVKPGGRLHFRRVTVPRLMRCCGRASGRWTQAIE